MHHYSLLQLREIADQLSIVSHITGTNQVYLRSRQIRQVDKALTFLENVLSPEFLKEIISWKEAFNGFQILQHKLNTIDKIQTQILNFEQKIENLKTFLRPWCLLEEEKRNLILQQGKRTSEFLQNRGDVTESSIINRYKRFCELKHLFVYVDQIPHILDAILHYTHKDQYQKNLSKITEKIDHVRAHIKIVKRGFWVACVLSGLIATIPISFPFILTLWKRIQRLKSHLNIYNDFQQRENTRLALAEEGSVVIKEIQNIIGNIQYDTIQNLLTEVKELRSEFNNTDRFLSMSATILNYIDSSKDTLVSLFGTYPEDPKDRFTWLVNNIHKYESAQNQLESLKNLCRNLHLNKKQAVKGYEREILNKSVHQLEISINNILCIPFSLENKILFSEMCLQLPNILKKIREIIFYISQNYEFNLKSLEIEHEKIHEYAQQTALFVLDAEIATRTQDSYSKNLNTASTLDKITQSEITLQTEGGL